MQFEKIIEVNMLYDFYGRLLSEKQREIFSLYYEDNLSLSEIASELSMSRQGVHDALKKSEKLLQGYEEKLCLIGKFTETKRAVIRIDEVVDELISENITNEGLKAKLHEVKQIIDHLDE